MGWAEDGALVVSAMSSVKLADKGSNVTGCMSCTLTRVVHVLAVGK